jgi:alpha-galactosidase
VLYLPPPDGASTAPPTGLLNLAAPAAQDWAIATYDRLIGEYDLAWIFYDNNIDPAPYWAANEPAHRRGRLQHDHIRGLWRVWDEVRRRHPQVVLENCSSGGRRIDLGTLARAHCHFSSDQFRHADSIRYQFTGANTVLPGDRVMSFLCLGLDDYPDSIVHTFFGGVLCITEGVERWSPELKARMRQHVDVYRSIRHLLGGDYYPLFPQPQAEGAWEGWQFHDPGSGEGVLVVFRGQSPIERQVVRPRGVDATRRYRLVEPYSREESELVGERLAAEGIRLTLIAGGSRVLRYRPE